MRRSSILGFLLMLLAPGPLLADGPESPGPTTSEYAARRCELMERLRRRGPNSVVVIRGAADPDIEGKFRQANDFAYLTGFHEPDAALILIPDENKDILYVPPTRGGDRMNSARTAPGEALARDRAFSAVESSAKFLGDLFTAVADPGVRRRGRPTVVYTKGTSGEAARTNDGRFARFLREGATTTEFRDVAPAIAEMRKSKSPAELAVLRRAIAITGDAQAEVIRNLRPGLPEYAIEGRILGTFTSGGAHGAAFPSIVGSGPNSTIPHYFRNDRTIASGDLLVVDIGADYRGYAADITRTFPADGVFTPRQREIYDLVLQAQKAVEAEMKPGKTRLHDMTGFTADFLRKSPLRAKDENGDEKTMDHFFVHGLGHFLGMDVHDVGDYGPAVKVGEVFTIEPGIYIKSENLGVRIEDDYVMTENGPEKLSKDIPSDPTAIEQLMSDARKSASSGAAAR